MISNPVKSILFFFLKKNIYRLRSCLNYLPNNASPLYRLISITPLICITAFRIQIGILHLISVPIIGITNVCN